MSRLSFLIPLSLTGGLSMFISMAAAEFFVQPDMFGGFLLQPSLWFWIFAESALWLFPVSLLGVLFLNRFRNKPVDYFRWITVSTWFVLGSLIIVAYKIFYFPASWRVHDHIAELTFGWVIPCLLIWIFFTLFSLRYFRRKNE
jgi:hypothetical protein